LALEAAVDVHFNGLFLGCPRFPGPPGVVLGE
jgi:hypothetical protein